MDKISINGLFKEELDLRVYNIVQELIDQFGITGDTSVTVRDEKKSYQSNLSGIVGLPSIDRHLQLKYTNEIVIERGVFNKINFDEHPERLKALVAHECSHILHKDSLYEFFWFVFGMISVFIVTSITTILTHDLFLILIVIAMIFVIIWRCKNFWRRKVEKKCDEEAVLITKDPNSLQEGLKHIHVEFKDVIKIAKTSEKIPMYLRQIIYFILGDTHPKHPERISYLEELKNKIKH
jgi:Zn-dependent protease with chaperone function